MKSINKWLYWSPRVLAIAFIAFLTMFSLDVFEMELSPWEIVVGLLMHNIPSIVLTVLLIIAWKREWVGAAAFIGAGLLYITLMITNVFHSDQPWYIALSWSFTIAAPALLIGILFLLNWTWKRKHR